jgi:hypothetical protein
MYRLAVTALFIFAFATVTDLRIADAMPISSDLYLSEFCAGCTASIDATIKPDLDWLASIDTSARDVTSCKYHGELYCEDLDDTLFAEAETDIIKSMSAESGSETSGVGISVEFRDKNEKDGGCTYVESKLRDPTRVRAECDNLEPGGYDLESFGVFTVTIVAVLSFVLLASAWLLLRWLRSLRLRNMIRRDKTTADLGLRRGGQRRGGPIRG